MLEQDPLERLRMFPGSTGEQVIALTDLWKRRSKRTFTAMRERMNELEDLDPIIEPPAFDNYFRRQNREKTPEEVVWALIRVMRDDEWLPQAQQCTLAEALYLAALKNVSVVTYARIYHLFPGQEQEFKELCPLGDLITERAQQVPLPGGQDEDAAAGEAPSPAVFQHILRWLNEYLIYILLALFIALLLWAFISLIGWSQVDAVRVGLLLNWLS